MNKFLLLFNLLAITALIASCASPGGGGQLAVAQSEKSRIMEPSASLTDLAALSNGNTAFGFDLFQALRGQSGNLLISPHSISVALAMTAAGARGATEQQMNQVLHFDLPKASLHPAFNALQLELEKREKNPKDPDQANFKLKVVNALWGQKDYRFQTDYLDLLAQHYAAGMRLLDYKADPEGSRKIINDWVAQQTAEKIKDLIPPMVINPATRLVLTNAIYFNAPWMYPFQENATRAAPFTLLDGSTIEAPAMNLTQSFGFYQGSGFTAVELPYSGRQVDDLLVPDAGKYPGFEKQLDAAQWQAIRKGLQASQVKLALPKFSFISEFNLNDPLAQLGMVDAFQAGKADFSGMDGSRDLFIQRVQHKAFIKLDENGTEAAAATAVVVGKTSMPAQPVEVKVDRPFLFVIQDQPTGEILFLGRVLNRIE